MDDKTEVSIVAPIWVDRYLPKNLYHQRNCFDDSTCEYQEVDIHPSDSRVAAWLEQQEVPYDMTWGEGETFPSGQCWVRFEEHGRKEVVIDGKHKQLMADIVLDHLLSRHPEELLPKKLKHYLREQGIERVEQDVREIPEPEGWSDRFLYQLKERREAEQQEARILDYLMDLYENEYVEEGAQEAAHSMARRVLAYAEMPPEVALDELNQRARTFEGEAEDG